MTEFELWIRKITGYKRFYSENIVFLCELYKKSPKSIYKYIRKSYVTPIIIQFSSIRYDIIFRGKIYYCNNDIRYSLSVWMIILYFHCNGEIYINEKDKFSIKDEIFNIIIKTRRKEGNSKDNNNEQGVDVNNRKTKCDNKNEINFFKNIFQVTQKEGINQSSLHKKFNPMNLLSDNESESESEEEYKDENDEQMKEKIPYFSEGIESYNELLEKKRGERLTLTTSEIFQMRRRNERYDESLTTAFNSYNDFYQNPKDGRRREKERSREREQRREIRRE